MDLFTWGGGGYATWFGISHSQQPHCCCANSPDISAHPTVCARVPPLNTVATSSGAIWGEWFQSSNFATSQKCFQENHRKTPTFCWGHFTMGFLMFPVKQKPTTSPIYWRLASGSSSLKGWKVLQPRHSKSQTLQMSSLQKNHRVSWSYIIQSESSNVKSTYIFLWKKHAHHQFF